VNTDEPIVDLHGALIGPEHVVVMPVLRIREENCQTLADKARIHTKVGLAAPLGSGPSPNITEHSLVEREEETGFQQC
jgi:hypothetical protein